MTTQNGQKSNAKKNTEMLGVVTIFLSVEPVLSSPVYGMELIICHLIIIVLYFIELSNFSILPNMSISKRKGHLNRTYVQYTGV